MKKAIVLVVLGALGYFAYDKFQSRNPAEIADPVFAEIRVDYRTQGREVNFVLYGKMTDEEDCRMRTARVWEKTISGCKECEFHVNNCQNRLAPRYARLFENTPIPSTYMSFTRGSRYERDGRMAVYGLTDAEGEMMCDMMRTQFQTKYSGTVECIRPRRN